MSTRPQSRGRQVTVKRSSATMLYWIIGALVLIGSGALVFFALRGNAGSSTVSGVKTITGQVGTLSAPVSYKDASGKEQSVAAGMYFAGNPDAKVKVIEYADFQCPACANFNRTMEDSLFKDYVDTGKIQFIYHEFPLTQHANAQKAAEAARCAGDQGADKFWQMHDVLFRNQDQWAEDGNPVTRFIGYSGDLGLDRTAFQSCINDGKYSQQVQAAAQASATAQIPATPTFVVNGQQVPTNGLRAAIDAALR